jgi:hypothetical protein
MPLHLRWRARQASLLAITTFAAGLALLSPTAASAHHGSRLESAVSEEAATSALTQSGGQAPAVGTPTGETPAETRGERRQRKRARREAASASGCSVELHATPSIVTASATLSVSGSVSCPEAASAAEQTVTLYQHVARTPGFDPIATATTEADGGFQFPAPPVHVNSILYVSVDQVNSARTRVQVAPQVTLTTPAAGTPLFVGSARAAHAAAGAGAGAGTDSTGASTDAVTFAGTVSPVDAGATVVLQREYRTGGWHRIGGSRVNDEGSYSIVHTFLRPGEANLRVVVRSHKLYMTSASEPVSYLISRRRARHTTNTQGPAEPITDTITATPAMSDVLAEAPLTVTGTVAPAHEGQLLELERREVSGLGYRVIATATESATGAYSIVHSFALAGTALLRVTVPPSPGLKGASTAPFSVEVTPAG